MLHKWLGFENQFDLMILEGESTSRQAASCAQMVGSQEECGEGRWCFFGNFGLLGKLKAALLLVQQSVRRSVEGMRSEIWIQLTEGTIRHSEENSALISGAMGKSLKWWMNVFWRTWCKGNEARHKKTAVTRCHSFAGRREADLMEVRGICLAQAGGDEGVGSAARMGQQIAGREED